MQFCGKQSYIRCIAHVLNRIVQKILKDLKTRTAKEAKELKDVDIIGLLNGVVKIRLLVLWICKTPQRRQQQEKLITKHVYYNIDTWWNATFDMLNDAIRCKTELIRLVKMFLSEIGLYNLSIEDWIFVQQLYNVLKPFNKFCKLVSLGQLIITMSISIYFHLSKHLKMAGA